MPADAPPLPPMPADPVLALAPYRPDRGDGPWTGAVAGHLLRRALGGASSAETARLAAGSLPEALDGLFRSEDSERRESWLRMGRAAAAGGREALAGWWLLRLCTDDRAPGTRLTLFWHDHFACGAPKVAEPALLLRQHRLFMDLGEGPFAPLLESVARDPAMLRYLDNDRNRRGAPNENLAREILELFSLGEGAYTEQDVQEAARALTGWTERRGAAVFESLHHDAARKTVLGKPVDRLEDLARTAAARPQCARFLAGRLWRFYVSPEPPPETLDLLAERWRRQDLEAGWLIRTLLSSRAFFSAEAWRSLVRSPVELAVAVVRRLGSRPDFTALGRSCAGMGQTLFSPPGVQGWVEGAAWIHPAAWIARCNFAARAAGGQEGLLRGVSLARILPAAARQSPAALARALLNALLDGVAPSSASRGLAAAVSDLHASLRGEALARAALRTALCLPEFHLA